MAGKCDERAGPSRVPWDDFVEEDEDDEILETWLAYQLLLAVAAVLIVLGWYVCKGRGPQKVKIN